MFCIRLVTVVKDSGRMYQDAAAALDLDQLIMSGKEKKMFSAQ